MQFSQNRTLGQPWASLMRGLCASGHDWMNACALCRVACACAVLSNVPWAQCGCVVCRARMQACAYMRTPGQRQARRQSLRHRIVCFVCFIKKCPLTGGPANLLVSIKLCCFSCSWPPHPATDTEPCEQESHPLKPKSDQSINGTTTTKQ